MDARTNSLEQKVGSLEIHIDYMLNDLNQKVDQLMTFMRENKECDESSSQVPKDNGKAHAYTATYANEGGAIGSRFRKLKPHYRAANSYHKCQIHEIRGISMHIYTSEPDSF